MKHLVLAFALCCADLASAQTASPPEYREWEFTPFAGGSFAGSYHFPTTVLGSDHETSRTVGMQYNSGYQLGMRVTDNFNELWAADLEYSFALQNLRFTNLSPDLPVLSLNNYTHHFDYNVAYMPLPRTRRFRPYVDAGAGASLFFINGDSRSQATQQGVKLRDGTWEFLFNIGGGGKYLVADQFAVTFDIKDAVSRIPRYGLRDTAQVINGQFVPGIHVHGILHNWQLNVGANFQWDEWNFRRRRPI